MNQVRYSPNIVVLRFPPLAAGKFLGTMLSYFDSFFYPLPIVAIHPLVEHLSNEELKLYGHTYAMASVPEKEMRHNWSFYEPKFGMFWGFTTSHVAKASNWDSMSGKLKVEDIEKLTPGRSKDILGSYMSASMIIHDSTYEDLSSIFPNAKIVNLTNYTIIQRVSMKFKSHHPNSHRNLEKIEGPNVINFSMQNAFSKSKFIEDVSALALVLSGNSKYDPRMEEYYDKYRAVHL